MPPNVSQKVISISDDTRRYLSDMRTLAKLEDVVLSDSSLFAWGIKTLRDSIIEMKSSKINLALIFRDAEKFKNHKSKKNRYLED